MTKRMLIDATHKEETRVAITDGNKLVEYDYESLSRKAIKGSIFLAKVTRVEPSLQAAFVNFGGNRHGFLPFSEIHPDYFRIPVADREALLAEQEELIKEHDEEQELEDKELKDVLIEGEPQIGDGSRDDVEDEVQEPDEVGGLGHHDDEDSDLQVDSGKDNTESEEETSQDSGLDEAEGNTDKKDHSRRSSRGRRRGTRRAQYRNRNVEVVGGEDVDHEQRFRFNLRRKYKIQEVIKRGQIMLVQANKEERGNKGAAVGTYLSLPGRYCVLMPNSPRAGGVSRKIANPKDRARMRDIVKSLDVPKGMSVIVRTAGVSRTKTEIKRDLDYLMRLWNSIRELTLQSTAPALVYEEADLIKRAVRDLYTRDVEEILISGKEGYKTARKFMKMMIPSHVKKVVQYEDEQLPLFNRYQIESQISEIGKPDVRLKSGGYLVINPTEALISVDVNSGKATKGRHIEETAFKTNLEAADEVARQLRLRDLGGLVVIDFIDMEDRRNNGKVERRMREALSSDRARVQVGRISSFGLMELSRQRLSPSLTEAQYKKCPNCNGVGIIPTADALSITVLRAIEEEGIRGRAAEVIVRVNDDVALYILNHKRKKLAEIETRYDFEVLLRFDVKIPACEFRLEVSRPAAERDEKDAQEDEPAQDSKDSRDADVKSSPDDNKKDQKPKRTRRTRKKVVKDEKAQDSQEDKEGVAKKKRTRRTPAKKSANQKNAQKKNDEDLKKDKDQKDHKDNKNNKEDKQGKSSRSPESKPSGAEGSGVQSDDDKGQDLAPSQESSKGGKASAKKPKDKKEEGGVRADDKDKSASDMVEKDYEVVNKPPKEKKKGWWNRLVE
ncbi:MAG: Rne/Rng family ribonuclease [Alphaproteobacteria bacterium]